jgi:hypothetical protein
MMIAAAVCFAIAIAAAVWLTILGAGPEDRP